MEEVSNNHVSYKRGSPVITPYGCGKVISYRPEDEIQVIQLPFGTLYAGRRSLSPPDSQKSALQLNVAYESLEKMRKLNLELQCVELGVPCDHNLCTICQLESARNNTKTKRFMGRNAAPKKGTQCLICASPTCSPHSSTSFRKENITLCVECESLSCLTFDDDILSNHQAMRHKLDQMIDVYDRVLLLLRYSTQFIDPLIAQLEDTEALDNNIGLTTSGVNMLSGALSIAGAATILTPAGLPLLMASLFFGGSSAAVQVGQKAARYFRDPNKVADRIIVVHGMLMAVLADVSQLHNRLAQDPLLQKDIGHQSPQAKNLRKKYVETITASSVAVGGKINTGVSVAGAAGYTGTMATTSSGLISAVPFIGTALSVVSIAWEAKSMANTLEKIHAGSPSDKADTLKQIRDSLPTLQSTEVLEAECKTCLDVAELRHTLQEEINFSSEVDASCPPMK